MSVISLKAHTDTILPPAVLCNQHLMPISKHTSSDGPKFTHYYSPPINRMPDHLAHHLVPTRERNCHSPIVSFLARP